VARRLEQTEKGAAGDEHHGAAVHQGMGGEPVRPRHRFRERLVARSGERALLRGDRVSLEWEVHHEVTDHEKEQNACCEHRESPYANQPRTALRRRV